MCPICGARLRARLRRPRLTLHDCSDCAHRVAIHDEESSLPREDYWEHARYDRPGFLTSLERTRIRQAKVLSRVLHELVGPTASILDYGTGRGWFPRACVAAGFRTVAGADTSEVAVRLLGESGIPAIRLPTADLPFAPDVVTFLDVIEHFDDVSGELAKIIATMPSARHLVVKVPDSQGLLYRVAEALSRVGRDGPLEQLYQVGTPPPHRHYFRRSSMRRLLSTLGWTIVRELADPEFEGVDLHQRVHATARLPRAIGVPPGVLAQALAAKLDMQDSTVYFARR